jgi:hypothetical protein
VRCWRPHGNDTLKCFSSSWKKVIAGVQRIHSRIGNARWDFPRDISTAISQNNAMVAGEDLARGAAGTVERPGRNARSKSGLNKSVLNQGWAEFRTQLDSKHQWRGGWPPAVPPQAPQHQPQPARPAGRLRRRTAPVKHGSSALRAAMQITNLTARRIFWRGDTALQPVERWRIQAPR